MEWIAPMNYKCSTFWLNRGEKKKGKGPEDKNV